MFLYFAFFNFADGLFGILPCQILYVATFNFAYFALAIQLQLYSYIAIQLYSYIPHCLGINGHPIARMDTILRQCEAPVKIYNSRWFPASNYRFKWSFIAGQGSNIKILKKHQNFEFFFGVLNRSRGSRGPSGRVQNPFRS